MEIKIKSSKKYKFVYINWWESIQFQFHDVNRSPNYNKMEIKIEKITKNTEFSTYCVLYRCVQRCEFGVVSRNWWESILFTHSLMCTLHGNFKLHDVYGNPNKNKMEIHIETNTICFFTLLCTTLWIWCGCHKLVRVNSIHALTAHAAWEFHVTWGLWKSKLHNGGNPNNQKMTKMLFWAFWIFSHDEIGFCLFSAQVTTQPRVLMIVDSDNRWW